jgi:septal ring factor EnvC (AmiA/AmiB activator)
MPQKNPNGIDVSEAEQRFLRRAFRRFALPYLLAFAVVAWGIGSWLAPEGAASPEQVSELQKELAALRETVAGIEGRFAAVDEALAKARERVASLEKRAPGKVDTSALEGDLSDATRRVASLERQIQEQAAAERIDALAARMTRLERQQREPVPAAPAPLPPLDPLRAPAPAAIPAP